MESDLIERLQIGADFYPLAFSDQFTRDELRNELLEAADTLAQQRAEIERLRQNAMTVEDEKIAYLDYVGDALGQAADGESLWDAAQRVLSERDNLRAQVEALRRDAERYRWLKARRVFKCDPKMDGAHQWHPVAVRLTGNTLDAAIDAVRGEMQ